MELRELGRSGLRVSPLCFGGNVFGWTAGEAESFRLLDRFVEAGGNFIDTADVYSRWAPGHQGGESETVIGNWLAQGGGRREKVVIATKVGMEMGPDRKGLAAAYIRRAVEDSLRRLRVERIDLYQAHKDDPETPLEETLAAFGRLIEEGKVRAIGASNYEAPRLREALETSARLGLPRYESLQPHYNLVERMRYEAALEEVCQAEGLGVIPYFSLAAGFLTGKYRSEADLGQSPRGQGVAKYLDERGLGVLAALDEVAGRHAATPARVALAWMMARPSITAPIASATRPEQLEEMLAATRLSLGQEDIERLDRASAG
ncbi:alcohol dehydrogenase [Pseudoroseomonas rhizosphaerae]|uniref:Alcohol dehydrogenase n=1 Tax=Teichococcus rhizosphaerae TaxID=1335062 RepID=A0A2C7AET0_9PROT|nr:aldo/keto reductase [Pseudoroseomonas rhizosphaerae]PHK95636.1 alcohol dehydrogenase [Pseudoroseomonas rhizosphaerae]